MNTNPPIIRIAVCADEMLRGYPTGTQTFMVNIISEWLQNHADRVELTFYATRGHNIDQLKEVLPPLLWRKAAFDLPYWPTRIGWLYGRFSATPKIGPHDVFFNGWHWPMGALDRPFVAVLHDLRPIHEAQSQKALPLSPCKLMWRWMAFRSVFVCSRRAATIICVSKYTRDHLLKIAGPDIEHKSVVIHHGIDLDKWNVPFCVDRVNDIFRKFGLSPDMKFGLGVGQHVPNKNFTRLIKAFKKHVSEQFPSWHLVVAGGRNSETPMLEKLISDFGLQNRIHLLGFIEDDELVCFTKKSQFMCYPSLFEGFGLPVIEAYAAGTPVICSNTTSLAEIGDNGAAVLVNPLNIDDIGSAMCRVISDDTLRRDLIKNGIAVAQSKSWARCATEYLKIMTSACAFPN